MTSPTESQFTVKQGKLTDVQPDSQNANRHTARGASTLERSLRNRGFFRPTAAFGKGVDKPVMGAGNLTQETAVSIGMDDAIFIYTDGTRPIVHVRTDIEPGSKEAQALALEDNRTAELSLSWDVEVLAGLDADVLAGLWTGEELDQLANMPSADDWGASLGALPEGDRAPFQQMTFTVSDEQAEQVKAALAEAKKAGPFVDTGNENSNGNALARICETYLTDGR